MTAPLGGGTDTVAAIELFLARVGRLTGAEWESVMTRAEELGDGLAREDLVRGAVVALTVGDHLSVRHLRLLYEPFAGLIPLASLEPGAHALN